LSSDRESGRGARRAGATLLGWLVLAAGAVGAAEPAATSVPVFSGERALAWVVYQCDLGPRDPGSEGNLLLREAIRSHADSLGLRCVPLRFELADPYSDRTLDLCNLVVSAGPGGGERLWLGAHFDTRPYCDRDPDPARRQQPLLGANDGASGVAVLLHLAELLAAQPPARGVDLIFFDGEDYGREGHLPGYCLGSTWLAEHWRDFGSPLLTGNPEGLIVLDMVCREGLSISMEGFSLAHADDWTRRVFARAVDLGLKAFRPLPGKRIYDDHVPFLQAGIPAVDLIDMDFPEWHTTGDVPSLCSAASLAQAGTLVTDIAYRPLAAAKRE